MYEQTSVIIRVADVLLRKWVHWNIAYWNVFFSNVRNLWIIPSLGRMLGTSVGEKLGRLMAGVDLWGALAVVVFFMHYSKWKIIL